MITERDYEILSAYVDNQLGARERSALESRLADDREFRLALKELRQDRLLLRKLPALRAPRNFTLTRAQAAAIRPARRPGFWAGLPFNAMRLATGLASLAFATLLGLDLMRYNAFVARESEPAVLTTAADAVANPEAPIAGSAPADTEAGSEIAALNNASAEPPGTPANSTEMFSTGDAGQTLEGVQGGGSPEVPTTKMGEADVTATAEAMGAARIAETTETPDPAALAFAAEAMPAETPAPAPEADAVDLASDSTAESEPAIQLWTYAAGGLALALGGLTALVWMLRRRATP